MTITKETSLKLQKYFETEPLLYLNTDEMAEKIGISRITLYKVKKAIPVSYGTYQKVKDYIIKTVINKENRGW